MNTEVIKEEKKCDCGSYQIIDYTIPNEGNDLSKMTPFDIMVLIIKRIKKQYDDIGTFQTNTDIKNHDSWTLTVLYYQNYAIVAQSNGRTAMYGIIYKYLNLRREIILQSEIFIDNLNEHGFPNIEDIIYNAESINTYKKMFNENGDVIYIDNNPNKGYKTEYTDKYRIIPYNID